MQGYRNFYKRRRDDDISILKTQSTVFRKKNGAIASMPSLNCLTKLKVITLYIYFKVNKDTKSNTGKMKNPTAEDVL